MPQRTNPFQELVALIMAVFHMPEYLVEETVLLKNEKTGAVRELDILITNQRDPSDRILVECRDHKRRQDVQWIDQLDGKARRLGVRKVVAVSASGFYDTAAAEAKDRGIETLHLKQAHERDWQQWRWSIPTLGLRLHAAPAVTNVELHICPEYRDRFPPDTQPADVFVVDARKRVKCPLKEWIQGYLNDPKTTSQLDSRATSNATSHYRIAIPCDPGIGVAVGDDGDFLPLGQLVLFVDRTVTDLSIPLEHYDVEGREVLVGEAPALGSGTRVGLHEKDGLLKLVLERRVRSPKKPETKP